MSKHDSDEESEETNPLSPFFNPLKALYSSKVPLPFPQATIFNNLIEYELVTASKSSASGGRGETGATRPKGSIPQAGKVGQAATGKPRGRTRWKDPHILGTGFIATEEMLLSTQKSKLESFGYRNAITRMSEFTTGPLSLLYRCMNQRCKIRVCTRSFKGLRGICSGYLVSFDKYYNMALSDVDEVWRRPSTGKRFFHEEKLTFSKIMECSKAHESQTLDQTDPKTMAKTTAAKQKMQLKRDVKEEVMLQKQTEDRERPSGSKNDEKQGKKRESQDTKSHRTERRPHRQKDERGKGEEKEQGKQSKHCQRKFGKDTECTLREETKESTCSQGKEDEEGKDEVEALQKQLAALRRELTSMSEDEGSKDLKTTQSQVETTSSKRHKENSERRSSVESKDLVSGMAKHANEEVDSRKREDSGNENQSLPGKVKEGSKADEPGQEIKIEGQQETTADVEATRQVEILEPVDKTTKSNIAPDVDCKKRINTHSGEISKVKQKDSKGDIKKVKCVGEDDIAKLSSKMGQLKIKSEEFQRRHVNQLFIRGDNVVLVSVDSNILPK